MQPAFISPRKPQIQGVGVAALDTADRKPDDRVILGPGKSFHDGGSHRRLEIRHPNLFAAPMPRFYEPDLGTHPDSPFARDASNKLVRRSYWLDMNDRTLVLVLVNGIGAHLTNDEKRAHLTDLKREHLIDQVCVQEIIPPEKE